MNKGSLSTDPNNVPRSFARELVASLPAEPIPDDGPEENEIPPGCLMTIDGTILRPEIPK